MRIDQNRKVQSFFVAEVIVHRGEIGPGPTTDFPDGCIAKAFLSKGLARCFQEALTGFGAGGDGAGISLK